jgi:TusA-related sulfurtransferase
VQEIDIAGVCDGGTLDCGGGLLIEIKRAMSSVEIGSVLEIRSLEPSVGNDLPAWCRFGRARTAPRREPRAADALRRARRALTMRSETVVDATGLNLGNGLLLKLDAAIRELAHGDVLRVHAGDLSVEEDLAAWCEITGNALLAPDLVRNGDLREQLRVRQRFTFVAVALRP